MIKGEIKQKLLEEIQKFGNVLVSCPKVGISRATYYRWKQKNKKFKEEADEAEIIGHLNIVDAAEHGLLQNIMQRNQRAIEYALNHNSPRYASKPTTIIHSNTAKEGHERESAEARDMINKASEIIREYSERMRELAIEKMKFYKEKGLDPNSAIYVSEEEFMEQMQDDANNHLTQPQSHP